MTLKVSGKEEIPLLQTISAGGQAKEVTTPEEDSSKEPEDSNKESKDSSKKLESSNKEPTGRQSRTSTRTRGRTRGRTESIGRRERGQMSIPIFAKEDTLSKGGSLHFVRIKAEIPATTLVEPVRLKDEHVKGCYSSLSIQSTNRSHQLGKRKIPNQEGRTNRSGDPHEERGKLQFRGLMQSLTVTTAVKRTTSSYSGKSSGWRRTSCSVRTPT